MIHQLIIVTPGKRIGGEFKTVVYAFIGSFYFELFIQGIAFRIQFVIDKVFYIILNIALKNLFYLGGIIPVFEKIHIVIF